MDGFDTYFVVNAETYNAVMSQQSDHGTDNGSNEIESILPDMPASVNRKCRKILILLTENGVRWNRNGIVKSYIK